MVLIEWIKILPKWYLRVIALLFIAYVAVWGYTIHLAQVERLQNAAYVMPVGPHDSTGYANLTNSLLYEGRFADVGEAYEYFHTPGYPAFAAVLKYIFGSFFAVTFVQILLVFATALMTVKIGELLVSQKVGLWASILFLINPLALSIAVYILTDTLFLFLFTFGVLALLVYTPRNYVRTALAVGVIFAAAIYVRPMGALAIPMLVAPLTVTPLSWKKKFAAAALMLMTIGVLMVPWMLRNHAESGVFGFSSLVALDMAYYNLPHFWLWQRQLPLDQGIAMVEKGSGVPEGLDANGYPANWYNLASSPALTSYEKSVLLASPFSYTAWHLYNSLGFFLNPAISPANPTTANLKMLLAQGRVGELWNAATSPWWFFIERIGVLLGILLFVVGVWVLRKKPLTWVFVFIIFYMAALGGPSAQARYRLPVEPLLSIFMTAGILLCIQKLYGNRSIEH